MLTGMYVCVYACKYMHEYTYIRIYNKVYVINNMYLCIKNKNTFSSFLPSFLTLLLLREDYKKFTLCAFTKRGIC